VEKNQAFFLDLLKICLRCLEKITNIPQMVAFFILPLIYHGRKPQNHLKQTQEL